MKSMKMFLIGMLFLGIPLMLYGTPAVASDILEFDMMAAVPENAFTIRGIDGGGAAWVVDDADGSLSDDGELEISVRGLVLADETADPRNPRDFFRGVVSCLTAVGGEATPVNVSTADFPATDDGDADIEEVLRLPDPCFAPIVFVVGGGEGQTNPWFAVTGGGPEPEEPEDEDEDDDLD